MKNTLLLALGGLVLALGACAAPETPADTAKPATSQTSTIEAPEPVLVESTSEADRVDQILASVMEPEGFVLPEGLYYEYAVLVCEGLDDGLDPLLLAEIAAGEIRQFPAEDHAMMVGASIGGLCPEHSDAVLGY